MLPRRIETERLTLRPFQPADLDDVFSYAHEPEWGIYLPVPRPYTRDHAKAYLATHDQRDWTREPVWALEHDGRVLGGIDLTLDDSFRAGIGYSTARAVWGRGFATEAARAVVDVAFGALPSVVRIYATCHVDNVGSARVMERLGMTREGVLRQHAVLRDEPHDELMYSILRDEWVAGRAKASRRG